MTHSDMRELTMNELDAVSGGEVVGQGTVIKISMDKGTIAGLSDALFWWSLVVSLVVAFVVTVPVNRALIARGKGHAVVHQYHQHRNIAPTGRVH